MTVRSERIQNSPCCLSGMASFFSYKDNRKLPVFGKPIMFGISLPNMIESNVNDLCIPHLCKDDCWPQAALQLRSKYEWGLHQPFSSGKFQSSAVSKRMSLQSFGSSCHRRLSHTDFSTSGKTIPMQGKRCIEPLPVFAWTTKICCSLRLCFCQRQARAGSEDLLLLVQTAAVPCRLLC